MKKYIIWGAGSIGKALVSFVNKKNIPVECIIDNDSRKWETFIEGIKITSPELALAKASQYIIVIAVGKKYVNEIKENLARYGISQDNIFLYSDVIKFDKNSCDKGFGDVSGYICHDAGTVLLKSSYKDKIIVDKENACRKVVIHEDNRCEFDYVFTTLANINRNKKYTPTLTKKDSVVGKNEPEYELERIAVYSYASEWSPEMYRNMCLFYVEFLYECMRNGLVIENVSYDDVIFYKGEFLYDNIFNIKKGVITYDLLERFVNKLVPVLFLMEVSKYDRAFDYINRDWQDMSVADVRGFISDGRYNDYTNLLESLFASLMRDDFGTIVEELKIFISSINLKIRDVYQWDSYQTNEYDSLKDITKWSHKQKLVIDMIKKTDARTMIDLAGNMGWYCVAMSKDMDYTVVADIDYNCIDFAFKYIRDNGIKNIYPIQINLIAPPMDKYKNMPIGFTGIEPWKKSAIERYKADVAVALAIEHHLACSQQLSFDEIIDQIALFTNKWLIVEYVHRNDSYVISHLENNSQFDWYTEDNFLTSLNRKFKIISRDNTSETRTVYLCERK